MQAKAVFLSALSIKTWAVYQVPKSDQRISADVRCDL